ncbi:MAG: hypothetical protein HYV63_20605 [Candidatus Schekmanbacteria bacterium]|nr:hypothetical protein [Candidatus Schekmanbacteria bacterium]
MIEAACVLDDRGTVIHWHLPQGRTGAMLPDSRELWLVLWEHRSRLGAVAHTHPWTGEALPSATDVTTFAACEAALGRRLVWSIVTADQCACFSWLGPGRLDYASVPCPNLRESDIARLRELSQDSLSNS